MFDIRGVSENVLKDSSIAVSFIYPPHYVYYTLWYTKVILNCIKYILSFKLRIIYPHESFHLATIVFQENSYRCKAVELLVLKPHRPLDFWPHNKLPNLNVMQRVKLKSNWRLYCSYHWLFSMTRQAHTICYFQNINKLKMLCGVFLFNCLLMCLYLFYSTIQYSPNYTNHESTKMLQRWHGARWSLHLSRWVEWWHLL